MALERLTSFIIHEDFGMISLNENSEQVAFFDEMGRFVLMYTEDEAKALISDMKAFVEAYENSKKEQNTGLPLDSNNISK